MNRYWKSPGVLAACSLACFLLTAGAEESVPDRAPAVEVHEAAAVIERVVDPNANIIFGMVQDMKMEDEVKVTIIATGFPGADALIPAEEYLFSQLEMASVNGSEDLDVPPFLRRHPTLRRRNKQGF